jgi:hypothetical protein
MCGFCGFTFGQTNYDYFQSKKIIYEMNNALEPYFWSTDGHTVIVLEKIIAFNFIFLYYVANKKR